VPATLFLEYRRVGNRSRYEAVRSERRNRVRALAMAECIEAKGRFLDPLLDGLWLTCEESFWGVPAHLSAQKAGTGLPDASEPIVDLFAADTGSLLAWIDWLLGEALTKLSPLVRPRLRAEIERRILEPCRRREDFWWMGFDPRERSVNNWNPWINSNWLTCALLLEPAATRTSTVAKIVRSIDRFLDGYAPDGGCDEGPGYWGHAGGSLFECLDLLRSASGGKVDVFDMPLVQEIGRYIVRTHIAGDWFVNFADASARIAIKGDLVWRYGRRIQDEPMMQIGAWAMREHAREGARVSTDSIARQLDGLFCLAEMRRRPEAGPPLVREAWMPGVQVLTARVKEGSASGLFLAVQGGHNAESHNHNDVGNFVVYANGEPALVDAGVESYTAKTFSSQRYDIWTMQSAWHNCPTINGQMQRAGIAYAAGNVTARTEVGFAEWKGDLEKAYPPEAGCVRWTRTLRLDRGKNEVALSDEFEMKEAGRPLELNFLCAQAPVLKAGRVEIGSRLSLVYDAAVLKATVEEKVIEDARLKPVWGGKLWRVRLTCAQAPQRGRFAVTLAGVGRA
jgi:hypothetical protein